MTDIYEIMRDCDEESEKKIAELEAENERLKGELEKRQQELMGECELRITIEEIRDRIEEENATLRKENAKLKCLALHAMSEYFGYKTLSSHKKKMRAKYGQFANKFYFAYRKAKKALREG